MPAIKIRSGKVREIYEAGNGQLLMVATDRVSAYDVVLPDPIPDKGKVLTGLTVFFASRIEDITDTHLITSDPAQFPEGWEDTEGLDDPIGRTMLVHKAEMIPVEFVVRGYLFGSAYEEYARSGSVAGIKLPTGLSMGQKLEHPILTPTTKAEVDHDEPLTHAEAAEVCGTAVFEEARDKATAVFERASKICEDAGLILADTKFEFGFVSGELVLADEILTPDSSRFWSAAEYEIGKSPPSYDKQFVRDYLDSIGWDRKPPAPRLPEEIVYATRRRYLEAYEKLTGEPFSEYLNRYTAG
ncbi:MAG: phosphoribosylaminoimidazolesuccinocarboxamide synthase [Acidimicrobiia bacterium]